MAARRNSIDDFSSDDAAKPSGKHLDPTRTGNVKFGLEETDENGEKAFHEIVTDIFRIGRDPDSNLVIRGDTKTSRRHASIKRQGIRYILQDDGSSNGTLVNGGNITGPTDLKLGDIVVIGSREFKFTRGS
jgi:pSer/pThr/pTyr-binding forkhead associated (FHA) protein